MQKAPTMKPVKNKNVPTTTTTTTTLLPNDLSTTRRIICVLL